MNSNNLLKFLLSSVVYLLISGCTEPQTAENDEAVQEQAQMPYDDRARSESAALIPPPAELHGGIAATPFVLENDMVVLDKKVAPTGSNAVLTEQLAIANKALGYLREGDLSLSKRVAVFQKEDMDIVVFDINLPETALGGDFSYSVGMKKGTGELINIAVP